MVNETFINTTTTNTIMKCGKCEYEWDKRAEEPKACPRCKSRLDMVKEDV